MANLVYGDPFGSYVKGQEAGQKQAIDLGEAQRKFRDSDREADFRKWYDPHRKIEVQTKENMDVMAQNKAQMQMYANAALTGSRQALDILRQHMANTMGTTDINFLQYDKDGRLDPQATALLAQFAVGNIPGALMSTSIMSAAGMHKFPQYYSQYGSAGAGQTHDPLGLNTESWTGAPGGGGGGGGGGTGGQRGQPGNIHTLPNILATDPTSSFYNPMLPDNTNSGIPVGDTTPRAFPAVSSMPGDETTSEFSYANRDTSNEPGMQHYNQGTVVQNTPRMAGEPDPQEPSFYSPTNDGRNADNVPMRGNQVSFARPEDNTPSATPTVASPQFTYPPAGQYPAPIRLTPNPTVPSQNRPTPGKQIWADSSETPATSGPTFQHNRRSSPKQMVTQ